MFDLIDKVIPFIPDFINHHFWLLFSLPICYHLSQFLIYINLGKINEFPFINLFLQIENEADDGLAAIIILVLVIFSWILLPLMLLTIGTFHPELFFFIVVFFFIILIACAFCHLNFIRKQRKLFFWNKLGGKNEQ